MLARLDELIVRKAPRGVPACEPYGDPRPLDGDMGSALGENGPAPALVAVVGLLAPCDASLRRNSTKRLEKLSFIAACAASSSGVTADCRRGAARFATRCRPARSRSLSSHARIVERRESISKRLLSARAVVRNDNKMLVTSRLGCQLERDSMHIPVDVVVRCVLPEAAQCLGEVLIGHDGWRASIIERSLNARSSASELTIMPQLCDDPVLIAQLLLERVDLCRVRLEARERALGIGSPELELAQLARRELELPFELGRRLPQFRVFC
jgi:hypothetical protein